MTAPHWKLSQVISLLFIAGIFALGAVGSVAIASDSLMYDSIATRAAG